MKAKLAVLDLVLRQLGIELDNSQEVQKVVYLVQAEGVPMGYRYAWYDNGLRVSEAGHSLPVESWRRPTCRRVRVLTHAACDRPRRSRNRKGQVANKGVCPLRVI